MSNFNEWLSQRIKQSEKENSNVIDFLKKHGYDSDYIEMIKNRQEAFNEGFEIGARACKDSFFNPWDVKNE